MSDSDQAHWYKDAIVYELHVRAFQDSDGDGIGDFRGLTRRLDYLQDLGVTAIWLLPFYPSPLRDDGYDIADYTGVHASYGTLRDFRVFLREARRQGLRVITELVLNHTSDGHPWFQRARRSPPGSVERDFYVWSDTPDRYREARIIFKDFESSNWAWDPVADAYYWHRFYSHQPDLNFENPAVHRAIKDVVDFWLSMGVDGMRLDAVPYLYQEDGTNCENLPRTHEFLKELRAHVDERFPNRMLLAEANQWPEDAVAYMGEGDECHMAFHFPVMPRMWMAIQMEDRFPLIDVLVQTPPIPDAAQWALFLRNHDELTLEMVTDEERDYMYRTYAEDPQARINLGIRRRLAPLLKGDRRKIELMNGLLFALPGTPVVYYGDEIGMGDNIYLGDRNGVRTPMQWSPDRNAGFSQANPQRLFLPLISDPEYSADALNVESQLNNSSSLLWWTKRVLSLRKRWKAFGRGTLEFLYPNNRKVLAFLREYSDERVLVVANLSRHSQYVELDLGRFRGSTPVELFGSSEFPPIGDLPYLLTLGPYDFYWFAVSQAPSEARAAAAAARLPSLQVPGSWDTVFSRRNRTALEEVVSGYLPERRWFGGKARRIRSVSLKDWVAVRTEEQTGRAKPPAAGYLTLVQVEYTEGDPETYQLPITFVSGERARDIRDYHGGAALAELTCAQGDGLLVDAVWDASFTQALLRSVVKRRSLPGQSGKIRASAGKAFRLTRSERAGIDGQVMGAEQSNTSIQYGDRFVLKLIRRPDPGVNPDLEIGRFLTDRARFEHVPPAAGALEYVPADRRRGEPVSLGVLHGYVQNEGDAWRFTVDAVARHFERALTSGREPPVVEQQPHPLDLLHVEPPDVAREVIGDYLGSARLLGQRTAELHLALASDHQDPDFAPEPFTDLYRRSLYQSMRTQVTQVLQLLRDRAAELPEAVQVLDLEGELMGRLRRLLATRVTTMRIRLHGDYHLGQVLHTGNDFVIIDFEGEPARPLSERRIKRSAMRDVAGMMRSFHYAAFAPLVGGGPAAPPAEPAVLDPWARLWYEWVASAYLDSYLQAAKDAPFVPADAGQLRVLLDAYLIEKAVYELAYEANNRPAWLKIPIIGLLQLLEADQ